MSRDSEACFGLPWPDLNEGLHYNDVVRPSDSEMKLVEFYSRKYKNSAPLQGWLQRIQNSQITVDGAVVRNPNATLRVGSELLYHRLPWQEPDAPYRLQILYEDDHMIALNKPSGLQVLASGLFQQRTVLQQLQWRQRKQSHPITIQESHAVPSHRLGRGTSGILLCAKTKEAKSCFAAYFADGTSLVRDNRLGDRTRKILKIYRALVSGLVEQDMIIINEPIGIMRYPGVAKGLYVASPSGKPALSKVHVLERDVEKKQTLVQVEIQTGRPHQIRIHLAFIGHPLVGDPLYVGGGRPKPPSNSEYVDETFAEDGGYEKPKNPVPGDCGYHLHAHQLALPHPTTNEVIRLTAPLPPILQTQDEAAREIKEEPK